MVETIAEKILKLSQTITIVEKILTYHRLLPGRNNCKENIKNITDYYRVETIAEDILKVLRIITIVGKILKVSRTIIW